MRSLASLAAALLLALLCAAPVLAQQADGAGEIDLEGLNRDRAAKQNRYEMGKRIPRYLSHAADAVDEGKPEEAERLLLRLDPSRLNPLQRAYVYRLLGVIAYTNDQHEKAIGYFEKVLEQQAMPIRDENKIRFTIAQLHAQLEHWDEVISWLDDWKRYETKPDPLGYYLTGLAYFRLKDVDAAIAQVLEALDRANEPRESWMKMLYALYTEKEDYKKATPLLEELLLRFPKKQYWVQLSLIYGAREDYPRSLAVQQIAYEQGYLTEDKELRRLARTYLFNELPYPAAKVLEAGLASGRIEGDSQAYELLANSWIAAREFDRSLAPLRRAAELSEGGQLYVRLGQVHLQREQWDQAAEMLEKAVEKGDLKKPGNVELLLGIAYYNADRPGRARQYFVRARQYDDSRKEADRWIEHIAREAQPQAG